MSDSSRKLELASIRIGSEVDLAFTVAALEALEVPYHVRNEHFGALQVGPRIAHLNERWIEIPREHLAAVDEALAGRPRRDRLGPRRWSGSTRLRALTEFLLFGWFVPGRAARLRPLRAVAVAFGSAALLGLVAVGLIALLAALAWASGRLLLVESSSPRVEIARSGST